MARPFGTQKVKPDELYDKFQKYIEYCKKEKRLANLAGFCSYIDIDRETFYNYKDLECYFGSIKRIEQELEDFALNCKDFYDTRIIAYLNNKFGWSHKQDNNNNNSGDIVIRWQEKEDK